MREIDKLYSILIANGFVVLRQATDAANLEWAKAEIEMLHNVPSLIGETNFLRHEYYWKQERTTYIEWVSQPGREAAKSKMLTYYGPVWEKLEPLVRGMKSSASS